MALTNGVGRSVTAETTKLPFPSCVSVATDSAEGSVTRAVTIRPVPLRETGCPLAGGLDGGGDGGADAGAAADGFGAGGALAAAGAGGAGAGWAGWAGW